MNANLDREEELQIKLHNFAIRQHSYELTQKLTYFVISIELIFCGYMLLNKEKLSAISDSDYLFLTFGIASFSGVLWRFFYNQTYHDNVHGISGPTHKFTLKLQSLFYWVYVILSIAAFIWALLAGFNFLS